MRCGPAGEGAGAMGPCGVPRWVEPEGRGLRPTTTKLWVARHTRPREVAGNTLSRRTMPLLSCGNDVDCVTWSTDVRR